MIRIARNISTNISRNVSRSIGTEPDPVLERFSGASAAYSLYDLGNRRGTVVETEATYSNPAVRLRRDSDNTHKSFPAGAFTQMLNWTNEDVVQYTSDFSAGADGWSATNGAVAGNIDGVGGEDDNLRLTVDGTAGIHRIERFAFLTAGIQYRVSMDFYIPSTNSHLDGIRIQDGGASITATDSTPTLDTWVSIETTGTQATGAFYIYGLDGGGDSFTDAGADDVLYIRNVSITQLTSNAYATTWYDQSSPTPIVQSASENDVANPYETHTPSGINGVTLVNSSWVGKSGFPLNTTVPTGYAITVQFDAVVNGGQIDTISLRESVVSSVNRSNTETLSASGSYSWTFTSTLDTAAYLHFATTSTTADVVISNLVITSHIYNDATQTTADNQPKVVDAGALVTDANGNYSLSTADSSQSLELPVSFSGEPYTAFTIYEATTPSAFVLRNTNPTNNFLAGRRSTDIYTLRGTTTLLDGGAHSDDPVLATWLINTTSSAIWADGVSEASGTIDTNSGIEKLLVANSGMKGSAIIIYPTDQSANRSAIEQSLSNTITTALS